MLEILLNREIMMYYFIFIAVYIFSAFLWWKYINLSHSVGGCFQYTDVGISALLIGFCPVVTTVFVIIGWVVFYPTNKTHFKLNKFFNIKK